jgi:hypothetical protein
MQLHDVGVTSRVSGVNGIVLSIDYSCVYPPRRVLSQRGVCCNLYCVCLSWPFRVQYAGYGMNERYSRH